jgi:hypothetical protein
LITHPTALKIIHLNWKKTMTYVYEKITPEDIRAYKLREANKTLSKGLDEDSCQFGQ